MARWLPQQIPPLNFHGFNSYSSMRTLKICTTRVSRFHRYEVKHIIEGKKHLCLLYHLTQEFYGCQEPRLITFTKIVCGCACWPGKSDFFYTNFLPNFPPISIPFSKEKHPILTKLGAFYKNLPKIHPIYIFWTPSSLMKTPNCYTKFCEKVPQKPGTYTYTMSMWEPHLPGVRKLTFWDCVFLDTRNNSCSLFFKNIKVEFLNLFLQVK